MANSNKEEDIKVFDSFKSIYQNARKIHGMSNAEKTVTDILGYLITLTNNPFTFVSYLMYNQFMNILDSIHSEKKGKEEIERFKSLLKENEQKSKDLYVLENLAPKRPDKIEYDGQTGLTYIIADGKEYNKVKTGGSKAKKEDGSFGVYIKAISGGLETANELEGGDGNDEIIGYIHKDIIKGGSGSDKLYGGDGNDILVGGSSDDILDGGWGNNIYVYSKGDGNDTILEYLDEKSYYISEVKYLNRILKLTDYTQKDIVGVTDDGKNGIKIQFSNKNDSITIEGADNYSSGSAKRHEQSVQYIEFEKENKLKLGCVVKINML